MDGKTSSIQQWSIRKSFRRSKIDILSSLNKLNGARRAAAEKDNIYVLTLHRIVRDHEMNLCRSPRGMVLRESVFASLIKHLELYASVVTPETVNSPERIPGRPLVLLTFDDGWLDNCVVAQPYLAAAGMKAWFFIPTGLAGMREPFWPERLLGLFREARRAKVLTFLNERLVGSFHNPDTPCPVIDLASNDDDCLQWFKQLPAQDLFGWIDQTSESLRYETGGLFDGGPEDPMEQVMTWDQLRLLATYGHAIGSHTCTHALLPLLSKGQVIEELENSYASLQLALPLVNPRDRWLSYPNGSVSPEVALATAHAGYRCGFINTAGAWSSKCDPYLIPRINIWDGTITDQHGRFSAQYLDHALYWKTRHD